jgi:hypothetical protein
LATDEWPTFRGVIVFSFFFVLISTRAAINNCFEKFHCENYLGLPVVDQKAKFKESEEKKKKNHQVEQQSAVRITTRENRNSRMHQLRCGARNTQASLGLRNPFSMF